MFFVGAGIKGKKGDDYYYDRQKREARRNNAGKELEAGYGTARNAWNNFCGWCKRKGHPISDENKEHMTQV